MRKPFKNLPILGLAMLLLAVAACTKEGTTIPSKTADTTKAVATKPVDTTKNVSVGDTYTPRNPGMLVVNLAKPQSNINQYVQYIPDGYNDKKTYKWPLVIFLHGTGEMGTDASILKNVGLMKVSAGKPFVILAPQCTRSWWDNNALQGFLTSVIKQYHIDSSRIYLTGLSMGGFGTWAWAIAQPKQFAALVPISGNGDTIAVKTLKKIPVWDFHNADDPTVSVWGSRQMVASLRAVGGNVKYTENPTGGHDAWTKAYASADLYTWLLAQKKP